jgi:hypothetical protein
VARIALALLVVLLLTRAVVGWWRVGEDYAYRFHNSFNAPQHDYAVYYSAGALVRGGDGAELYEPAALAVVEGGTWGDERGSFEGAAFFNPPFVALAFVPYSYLPIGWASLVAGLGAAAAFSALAAGGTRLLGLAGWRYHVGGAALFLASASVGHAVFHGQLTPFLLAGWLCFAAFSGQGRQRLAGASLGLLLVKPQMLALIVPVLVWKRQWSSLGGLAAVAIPLVAISLVVAGPMASVSYPVALLRSTSWDGVDGVSNDLMLGWLGLTSRYAGDPEGARMLAAGLALVTAAAACVALRGSWSPEEPLWGLQLAAIICGTLLINPHFWLQDAAQLAVVVGLGARFAQRTGRRVSPWALAYVALAFVESYHHQWVELHGLNLVTPAIAVLFAGIVACAIREVRIAEPTFEPVLVAGGCMAS